MEIRRIDSGLDGFASHSVLAIHRQQCVEAYLRLPLGISEDSLTFPPVPQYQLLQLVQAEIDRIIALDNHVAFLGTSRLAYRDVLRQCCSAVT